jgi:hypothetical protein
MILETIFYYTGGIFSILFIILLLGSLILGLFYYLFNLIVNRCFWHHIKITFKALFYHFLSEHFIKKKKNSEMINKLDLKEGREHTLYFKNKKYIWKLIKIEDTK